MFSKKSKVMQTQIIIFGSFTEREKEVFDALEQFQNWEVASATNVEMVLEKMHRQTINLVIFTEGVTELDENKLRKIGVILNEEIVFLRHSGQASFKQNIVSLINQQRINREYRYAVLDDALKEVNISLN